MPQGNTPFLTFERKDFFGELSNLSSAPYVSGESWLVFQLPTDIYLIFLNDLLLRNFSLN